MMKSFHKMPCRYKDMAAVCLVSCHKFGKDKVQKEVGQNDTESVPTKPSCSLGYGGVGSLNSRLEIRHIDQNIWVLTL